MSFGENVKKRREELKMTQEQLAEKVGVSFQFISFVETGRKTPNVNFGRDLAKALKCSLDSLTDSECA